MLVDLQGLACELGSDDEGEPFLVASATEDATDAGERDAWAILGFSEKRKPCSIVHTPTNTSWVETGRLCVSNVAEAAERRTVASRRCLAVRVSRRSLGNRT